jgi:hypothetical protein
MRGPNHPRTMKGTGFSPYISAHKKLWALAPEGEGK